MRTAPLVVSALLLWAPCVRGQVLEPREGLEFFDTGPLRVREQFLLGMGFLQLEPTSAVVLGRGAWQIDLVQSLTNTWVFSEEVGELLDRRPSRRSIRRDELQQVEGEGDEVGIFLADGEVYRTSLSVRYGIGHRTQLFANLPVLDFRGGAFDGPIEAFHTIFGFGDALRPAVARGDYTVYLRDERGNEVFRQRHPNAEIGDITLGAKVGLPSLQPEWILGVEGLVKLPTGDEELLYGSGTEDFGLQFLATRYFARSCFHIALGITYLGRFDAFQLKEQLSRTGTVSYERALGGKTSVVVQAQISQSPFDEADVGALSEVAYLIDLGFKWGVGKNTVLFVAASENAVHFLNSADFGVHTGITWTFSATPEKAEPGVRVLPPGS